MPDAKSFSKTEIYEALYNLNAGIEQFLNALTVLEDSGLGFSRLSAHRVLAEEMRAGINQGILTVLEQIEARDWAAHEKNRLGLTQTSG